MIRIYFQRLKLPRIILFCAISWIFWAFTFFLHCQLWNYKAMHLIIVVEFYEYISVCVCVFVFLFFGQTSIRKLQKICCLQVVRSRLQEQGHHSEKRYSGVIDCIRKVFQQEGVQGFYRGCATNLLRTTPAAVITFTSFEMIHRFLVSLFPSDPFCDDWSWWSSVFCSS